MRENGVGFDAGPEGEPRSDDESWRAHQIFQRLTDAIQETRGLESLGFRRRDGDAGLPFLQDCYDLWLGESLLHVRFPLRKRTLLSSRWPGWRRAGHDDFLMVFTCSPTDDAKGKND
jgi:hypothetical protein